MTTEFINVIGGPSEDYSSMATWEADTDISLTAATTLVFAHSGITGTLSPTNVVTGATSGTTGTIVAVVTSNQILLSGISGSGFVSGEVLESGANSVTISDAGDDANVVLEIHADASPLAQAVVVVGATTSTTNYRHVRSATTGVKSDVTMSSTLPLFFINELNFHLTDINATNTASASNGHGFRTFGSGYLVNRCRFEAALVDGLLHQVDSVGTARNTASVDCGRDGFSADNFDNIILENCTAGNCGGIGFNKIGANGVALANNCVGFGNTGGDWVGAWTGGFNASSDTTEPGLDPITLSVVSADFVDEAGGDFHLSVASALLDSGDDLSGIFTVDYDNDVRSRWSAGFDDGPAVAGSSTPKGPLGHPFHGPFGGPIA